MNVTVMGKAHDDKLAVLILDTQRPSNGTTRLCSDVDPAISFYILCNLFGRLNIKNEENCISSQLQNELSSWFLSPIPFLFHPKLPQQSLLVPSATLYFQQHFLQNLSANLSSFS